MVELCYMYRTDLLWVVMKDNIVGILVCSFAFSCAAPALTSAITIAARLLPATSLAMLELRANVGQSWANRGPTAFRYVLATF